MKIKLDQLGQFYSAINNEKNPGTFNVGVYLKEPLDGVILQNAVNDIMKRLPHMNVVEYSGIMNYYHQAYGGILKIEKEDSKLEPCRFFNKGSQLLRIMYGERHFTLEVLHSVCDGRSLAMVASSLLIRYYELMGIESNKEGFIDCNADLQAEELEDAYVRYADMREFKSEKEDDIYVPKHETTATKIITQKFDLVELKNRAKSHDITISEYIIALIVSEFTKQRRKDDSNKMIIVNVPIDCRGFFPSKSLRNFVSHKVVKISKHLDFIQIAQSIKKQLSEITPDYIQGKISETEKLIRLVRFIPIFIKKRIIQSFGRGASAGYTTGFSNLGLIKLPKEIQDKVDMYSFALGAEPNMPYQFACVAIGNTLTLSTTTTAKDTELIDRIGKALLQ